MAETGVRAEIGELPKPNVLASVSEKPTNQPSGTIRPERDPTSRNGSDPLSTSCAFIRCWAAPLRQVIIKVQVELLSAVGVERIKRATSSGSSI